MLRWKAAASASEEQQLAAELRRSRRCRHLNKAAASDWPAEGSTAVANMSPERIDEMGRDHAALSRVAPSEMPASVVEHGDSASLRVGRSVRKLLVGCEASSRENRGAYSCGRKR